MKRNSTETEYAVWKSSMGWDGIALHENDLFRVWIFGVDAVLFSCPAQGQSAGYPRLVKEPKESARSKASSP